jgi:branched-chain amino acid transport system permease protein
MKLMKNVQVSTWVYLLFACLLAVVPFVYDNLSMLFLIVQIFIFGIFAMSYDLLLGYTGIVSFGHAMFFGVGAYGVSIVLGNSDEPTMSVVIFGALVGIGVAALISLIAGVLTLRLKSHFYAMLTLALAGLFLAAAEKMRDLTGGSDGILFKVPDFFKERTNLYLVCLISLVVIFFILRRVTSSPLGRVLVAIRENEQRTMSLGYKIFPYKLIISVISGVIAAFAGVLYAISIRFIDTTVFAVDVTLDALLMTIIGGVGTLIGPIIGAGIIEYAHHFLSSELADVHWIFERWIILFGIVYILAVIFFPRGIAGTINGYYLKRKWKRHDKNAMNTNKNIAS